MEIQDLYIYPIKSLGGFRVDSAEITPRGLRHDRRWMLTDPSGRFLSQREFPVMSLLRTAIDNNMLTVWHKRNPDRRLQLPLAPEGGARVPVQIWDDEVPALPWLPDASQWFSEQLGQACQLVYMPDDAERAVDPRYGQPGDITSFSDGYPILLVAQASLDDLNQRLSEAVSMDRFRPNIVLRGGEAFVEDRMRAFQVGDIQFRGVKPCARCVIPTIDPDTAIGGKEPTRTLATYRRKDQKIFFGQNVLADGTGLIRVGDAIQVSQWVDPLFG